MTKPSTVPYAHEPELIARLLGVALEAVNAYSVRLLRIEYEESCMEYACARSVEGSGDYQ